MNRLAGAPVCKSDPRVHALTEALVPRVKRIAYRMKRRLPAHVEVDDLIGAGLLGLAQASAHWNSGEDNAFIAYAIRRAMGAMLDELRKNDQLTRAQRRLASRLFETEQRLATRLGRPPDVDEVAREIGMSPSEVEDARSRTVRANRVSLSVMESICPPSAKQSEPEYALDQAQREKKLQRALENLPDRLRIVVDMSCAQDLTLREIGTRLGVTEARACQLRQQAMSQLRRNCADTIVPPAYAVAC